MKKTFASRLEELRAARTQKDFAKLLGVPLTSYTNWILRMRSPSIEVLESICTKLGVSADYLLGHTDDPTPRKSSGGVHINGVSHSVVNGHAVNSSISNGVGKDDSFVDRLKALEKAVEDLNVAVFRTEPVKRMVRK